MSELETSTIDKVIGFNVDAARRSAEFSREALLAFLKAQFFLNGGAIGLVVTLLSYYNEKFDIILFFSFLVGVLFFSINLLAILLNALFFSELYKKAAQQYMYLSSLLMSDQPGRSTQSQRDQLCKEMSGDRDYAVKVEYCLTVTPCIFFTIGVACIVNGVLYQYLGSSKEAVHWLWALPAGFVILVLVIFYLSYFFIKKLFKK